MRMLVRPRPAAGTRGRSGGGHGADPSESGRDAGVTAKTVTAVAATVKVYY